MSRAPVHDAVRIVRWVRELDLIRAGPLVAGERERWVLCTPAPLAPDALTAASVLSGRAAVDGQLLGASLGARATVLVDDAQLARWWRAHALLRGSERKAQQLAVDGVPGLRQFRRGGIETLLDDAETRLVAFRRAIEAGGPIDGAALDGSAIGGELASGLARRLRPLCGEHTERIVAEVVADGSVHCELLAVRLLYPASEFSWPTTPPRFDLVAAAHAAGSLERCSQLWPALNAMESSHLPAALAASNHPVGHIELLVQRSLVELGDIHAKDRRRSRALGVIAQGFETFCEEVDLFGEVLEAKEWESLLLLTMLLWQQRTTARFDPAAWEQLLVALRQTSSPVARALRRWAKPTTPVDPATAQALRRLGVDEADVARHLHHRELLGLPAELPASLRNLLQRAEREQREAAWLHERLTSEDITAAERSQLDARLARLSGEAAEGRAVAAGRAALRSVRRATADLAERSMRVLLEGALIELAAERYGLALQAPLAPAAYHALLLLDRVQPGSSDDRRLADLVASLQRGDNELSQPGNDRWLAAAARNGVDVDAWRRGFRSPLRVLGQDYVVAIERDPLEVLRMGSYFGTCLDLHEGFNGLSLVANVADVNKAVLYVRRNNGKVVARKLIGLTSSGELAGYRTYAHEHPKQMRAALVDTLAAFAGQIGARLSDTATPERLGGGFWYDDGNESWAAPAPGEALTGPAVLWRARRDHDTAALRQLATHGEGHGAAIAALHLSRQADGDSQPTEIGRLEAGRCAAVFRSRVGETRGAIELSAAALPAAGFEACPLSADAGQLARMLSAHPWVAQPSAAADVVAALVMPASALARVAAEKGRSMYSEVDLDLTWYTLPAAIALLRPDMGPLRRAVLANGRLARSYGHQHPLPECGPLYRRDLSARDGEWLDMVAMALGRIANPGDGQALLAALKRRPRSLPIAWAATRCGMTGAVDLWAPDIRQFEPYLPFWWIPCARTVGGPLLAVQLRRWIRAQLNEGRRHPLSLLSLFDTVAEFGLGSFDPRELQTDIAAAVRHEPDMDVDGRLAGAVERWERAVRLGELLRQPWPEDSEGVRPLWALAAGLHDHDLVLAAGAACRDASPAAVGDGVSYLVSVGASSMSAYALRTIAGRADSVRFSPDDQVAWAQSMFAGCRFSAALFLVAASVIERFDEPALGALGAEAFAVTSAFEPDIAEDPRFLAADRLSRASAAARGMFANALLAGGGPAAEPAAARARAACEAVAYCWEPADAAEFIDAARERFAHELGDAVLDVTARAQR